LPQEHLVMCPPDYRIVCTLPAEGNQPYRGLRPDRHSRERPQRSIRKQNSNCQQQSEQEMAETAKHTDRRSTPDRRCRIQTSNSRPVL
jgi:hypothetical protein